MVDIPFFGTDYSRQVAQEPYVQMYNRYAEKNPALNDSMVSVISRPAMKKCAEVGSGPIRKVFSSPGVFDGDAFIVSGTDLHRLDRETLESTLIGTISTLDVGDVSMATTAPIGEVPAYLYIAEGSVLWVYTDNSPSRGRLQFTGPLTNGEQVRIGDVYYQFTTGSVDSGTPDGSSGNPWLINMNVTLVESIENLYVAIDANGVEGSDYSTGLTAHPTVQPTGFNATELSVESKLAGGLGNTTTTTETGSNMAWDDATLTDGGSASIRQVYLPDDLGAVSVAHINSYIIVIPQQNDDNKGQFYWIDPGENTVDPLNFATAERNPDGLHQVVVFGDLFWLLGENTTEPWQTTGDVNSPMQRYRGILFDRGSWEGTAVQVKDSLIVVDEDGGVFQIQGGQKRISRPDIEERIRRAKENEKARTNM
ncbi:MAG: putative packaged DNA stabilization protein [Prokaryotic dsDNA virus sp.]|nr:MAG: putative packaged DNA stabilization protein [Prokaryotic dsDNA virus sp.]|tara:strand:+ start:1501 stop:2769 length:1269 start_codon:yes stop_codon:yes gene_type:complete